jgi:hypothetical protein
MFRHYQLLTSIKHVTWLLLSAIIATVLSIGQLTWQPASAAPAAAPTDAACTPTQVMVWPNRIHVRCATAVSGISFFTVNTNDTANAARVLSLLTTAQVAGRTLTIRYEPNDLSGSAIGCLNSNCRLIIAVGFGQ